MLPFARHDGFSVEEEATAQLQGNKDSSNKNNSGGCEGSAVSMHGPALGTFSERLRAGARGLSARLDGLELDHFETWRDVP